jgi:hypothetical protein
MYSSTQQYVDQEDRDDHLIPASVSSHPWTLARRLDCNLLHFRWLRDVLLAVRRLLPLPRRSLDPHESHHRARRVGVRRGWAAGLGRGDARQWSSSPSRDASPGLSSQPIRQSASPHPQRDSAKDGRNLSPASPVILVGLPAATVFLRAGSPILQRRSPFSSKQPVWSG